MNVRPDPSFYPSPRDAMNAPPEKLAFTLMLSPDFSKEDGLAIVDVDPGSDSFGKIVHSVHVPYKGDEFHHFGWNACSASLSPMSGHAFLERRYLIVPGIRSSRIYVFDVKEPLKAKIHKIIEPEEVFEKTGYSRPHTIHCGPEGIYVSTLGGGGGLVDVGAVVASKQTGHSMVFPATSGSQESFCPQLLQKNLRSFSKTGGAAGGVRRRPWRPWRQHHRVHQGFYRDRN